MTEYKIFIDTNIWIYAFVEKNENKRKIILEFLEQLLKETTIVVSIQVINEFHYACFRKYKLKEDEIYRFVNDIKSIAQVSSLDFDIYEKAFKLRKRYNISFWDSLIIAAAVENNCKILYSEDMQDKLKIDNLIIKNPFNTYKGE